MQTFDPKKSYFELLENGKNSILFTAAGAVAVDARRAMMRCEGAFVSLANQFEQTKIYQKRKEI